MNGLELLAALYPWPKVRPNVPGSEHTWYGPANEGALRQFLTQETGLIVEVGSWMGFSARRMLAMADRATLICIDHWEGGPDHVGKPEYVDVIPTLYETFLVSCWEFRQRIIPLRNKSVIGLELIHRLNLVPDLIYLDGSHEYEDVVKDLIACLQFFPEAVIVGDDWTWSSVATAVADVARLFKLSIISNGICWWIHARNGGDPA